MAVLDGKRARSSFGPSAQRNGSGMKRWEDNTSVHVSEGSSRLSEIFAVLHFHAVSQQETPTPGAGGEPVPAQLDSQK